MTKEEFHTLAKENISPEPMSRMAPTMQTAIARLKDKGPYEFMIDVHAHCFTVKNVPKNFINGFLQNHLWAMWIVEQVLKLMHKGTRLFRGRDYIYYKRFSRQRFVSYYTQNEKQDDVFQKQWGKFNYYFTDLLKRPKAPHHIICELTMDMQYGIGGGTDETFHQQLEGLDRMRNTSRNAAMVIPFVACDPRNPTLYEDFLATLTDRLNRVNKTGHAYFDTMSPYYGVKIYPCLGYLPSHPLLMEIFKICEEKNIPVTTHCGGGSVTFKEGSYDKQYMAWENGQLIQREITENFNIEDKEERSRKIAKYFNSPAKWQPVFEAFPKLKVNLAHMGSTEEWYDYRSGKSNTHVHEAIDMCNHYANAYADISYSYSVARNLPVMRDFMTKPEYATLQKKMMYGTDFYMTENEKHIATMTRNLFDAFKDNMDGLHKLCALNTLEFLGVK